LTNPIHKDHQREWFIQGLLPLTHIPLTQQRIATLVEALEEVMNIDAMAECMRILRVMRPIEEASLMQMWSHISSLTKNIQELTLPKISRPQIWCTGCYTEGHLVIECFRLRGVGSSSTSIVPPLVGPSRGVVQVSSTTSFHGLDMCQSNITLFLITRGFKVMNIVKFLETQVTLHDLSLF
jgi:hypothetical protein